MSDDKEKSPFTDHPDRPIKKRRGRGPAKKKGVPSRKEMADLSRLMYTNAMELLEHKCPDTGLPTMSPALMTAVSKLVVESSSVYKEDKKDGLTALDRSLKEKRERRKLRIVEDPHTNPPKQIPPLDLGIKTELPPEEKEADTTTYDKAEAFHKRGIRSNSQEKN